MEQIILILNKILRLLQTVIILGSIAIFIYLGILFYFKKFDEVKKNLPYVILGLVLLIAVGSIPVIILSFLEKNISQPIIIKGNVNCQIIRSSISSSFLILNNLIIEPSGNICQLSLEFETEPNKAYVICRYGNDNQERINCWGIYGDRYDTLNNKISGNAINFSSLGIDLNNLESTRRLSRFPSTSNTVYCSNRRIFQILNIDPSNKNYAFIIFSAIPNISPPCNSTTSDIVNVSSQEWIRIDADIFGAIATTTR